MKPKPPPPVRWVVTSNERRFNRGPSSHPDCIQMLDEMFTELFNDSEQRGQWEELAEALAKVRALKPEQDAQFYPILLDGFKFPVQWTLRKAACQPG
jgi:hypothetical protein